MMSKEKDSKTKGTMFYYKDMTEDTLERHKIRANIRQLSDPEKEEIRLRKMSKRKFFVEECDEDGKSIDDHIQQYAGPMPIGTHFEKKKQIFGN